MTPFLNSLGKVEGAPIVSAAVMYDDVDGTLHMLVVNQAIFFAEMDHNLLCPMQIRDSSLELNKKPKFLCDCPTKKDHALVLPDGKIIPLGLVGITSFFPMRKPTIEEEERFSDIRFGTIRETLVDQTHYELTASEPEWDPQSKRFAQMEDAMTDDDGEIVEDASHMNLFSLVISHCCNSKNEEVLLLSRSNDWIAAMRTSKRPGEWNEKLLSKNWGISPELAATTLRKTTRLGVRYFGKEGPKSVSRRFPSGDRPLRYRRLACKVFHDTFFSSIESARGFKCAQIYATDFGWVRVFPMVNKSDVHHTIDDFFHRYGVPESLVSDNAQELTKGQFGFRCRQARCRIGTVIPHSPWQNRAKSEIRENKRMTGRWMVKTSTPRRLWCYCSELAAKIRSHTALKIYGLKGEVPESVITGQTADISHLCEFSWYQWIYFNEPTVSYPKSKERLGRYLGPCPPGLGSVMTYYILGDEGSDERHNSTTDS